MPAAALATALPGLLGATGALTNLIRGNEQGRGELERALELYLGLQPPAFNFRELPAPQLDFVSEISPRTYEPSLPSEVRTGGVGPTRPEELASLAYLRRVAQEGLPALDRLSYGEATDTVARESTRSSDAVRRSLAERGRLSGGQELLSRILASQGEADLLGQLGRGLAQDAIERRYRGAVDSADLAGQVRLADERLGVTNADMINRFNEFIANAQTAGNRFAAEQGGEADVFNAAQRQRIASANPLLNYQTGLENVNRQNLLQGALSDFELARTAGATGQLGGLAQFGRLERGAEAQNIGNISAGLGEALSNLLSYEAPKKEKKT